LVAIENSTTNSHQRAERALREVSFRNLGWRQAFSRKPAAREANATDDAHQPAARKQYPVNFLPDFPEFLKKILIVHDMP